METKQLNSDCFNGIYREIAELIGAEDTVILHEYFAGQHIAFPKKLIADRYIHTLILEEYNGSNGRELSKKYGYTYRWFLKLVKRLREEREKSTM